MANAYWGNAQPLPSGLPIAQKLVNPSFIKEALPKMQFDFVAKHGSDAPAGDVIVHQHVNDPPEQKKLDELVAKFSTGKNRMKCREIL